MPRLDLETVEAIHILADAVRYERVPGVVEFRQLERALQEAATQATEEHLAEAAAAFRALDREFRTRVINRAHALAQGIADRRRRQPARTEAASPFLAVLNQGRPRRG